jgi:AraC-like DNA-binding protein
MADEAKRGRAAFAPSDDQRAMATGALADGESIASIASRLKISAPTFRRAFADEIETDAQRRRSAASDPATLPLMSAPFAEGSADLAPSVPRRGRPRYKPTREDRITVAQLVAMGWPQKDIAAVLEISEPTLARGFRDELHLGALKKEKETVAAMFRAANKGSVPAQKELLARFDAAKLERLGESMRAAAPEPKKPAPESAGKKVLAAQAASEVITDSDWADLLKPGAETAGTA